MGKSRNIFFAIALLSSVVQYSCGNNNDDTSKTISTPYNDRVLKVGNNDADFASVKEFLQEEDITVYEVSEVNTHLIVRIKPPNDESDLEFLAYRICGLVSDKGNSYSMVVLRDSKNNSIVRAICDDGSFLTNKIINSYKDEKFKVVEDFLREANVTVYEVSEHNSHLIVRIDKPRGMERPEGYAEIICGLVAGNGYSMVALRDYEGNSIGRAVCR